MYVEGAVTVNFLMVYWLSVVLKYRASHPGAGPARVLCSKPGDLCKLLFLIYSAV